MLPTKFRFIWLSGYRGEDFLGINQSETRIAYGQLNEVKIGWKVLSKDCSFCPDPLTNKAAIGNSCF
jgi:hypothetical protein